jgi:hypothetical protein
MPLDWGLVMQRYGSGAKVPTVRGRTVTVTGVDEEHVYVKSPLWQDALARAHLEQAVHLIERGTLTRRAVPDAANPRSFAEEYRLHVADARGSTVAYLLKDLGYLE